MFESRSSPILYICSIGSEDSTYSLAYVEIFSFLLFLSIFSNSFGTEKPVSSVNELKMKDTSSFLLSDSIENSKMISNSVQMRSRVLYSLMRWWCRR